MKKFLDRIFIDGLTGMAQGLFATLIIGTIIQQIGTYCGGNIGDLIFTLGKVAAGPHRRWHRRGVWRANWMQGIW